MHNIDSNYVDNVNLEEDSFDYDILQNAVEAIKDVDGLILEIGTRRGGSLKYIVDGIVNSNPETIRNIVSVDPYGNIEYNSADHAMRIRLDYTNNMKNEALCNIYDYIKNKPINFCFFNLEDIEFFKRFADGVPIYNETKKIINEYALVFFDGPHDTDSILIEVNFVVNRMPKGSYLVFDDYTLYNYIMIENYLISSLGFKFIEQGKEERKISYKKI